MGSRLKISWIAAKPSDLASDVPMCSAQSRTEASISGGILMPEMSPQDRIEQGTTLAEMERYEEALTAFEQALYLDPADAHAFCKKGNCLAALRRHEAALAAFDRAIYLDPTYAGAYYNKGDSLEKLGRLEEALRAFEEVLRLTPHGRSVYYRKGEMLLALYPHLPPLSTKNGNT